MENGFIYLIKASGLIGLFYFAYFLLLRKETFFSANRWFLLLGLITSTILPLFFITKIIWIEPTTDSLDWSNIPITISVAAEPAINWYLVLAGVYAIGIAISFLKLVFDFKSLIQLLKGKTIEQQGNFKLIDIAENIAPFSYFNYIVYNSALYTAIELENILEHEKVHSQQKHSMDVLISRLLCILFWFNPLIWLYKKAIAQNLEFIADSEASKKITDKKAYQFTLIKITTQENCVALTNHFYQSLIKKRIIMLNQNQSKKSNSWKYITVFPALVAFVFLFQIEVVAKEKEVPKQEKEIKSVSAEVANIDIKKNLDTISKEKKAINSDKNNIKTTNNTVAQLDDKTTIQSVLKQDINKPLIIIDGVKQDSNFKIEEVNPNNIQSINVLKGPQATMKYNESGKNGVMEITTKQKNTNNDIQFPEIKVEYGTKEDKVINGFSSLDGSKPLIIVDGKAKDSNFNIEEIPTDRIAKIDILKGINATGKYGDSGKNGIIEITTKEKIGKNEFKSLQSKTVQGFQILK